MTDEADNKMVPVHCGPSKAVVPLEDPGSAGIRSATEVKHGTVHFLTQFSHLQTNTNLNIPPSNWLRGSSKLEQHVRNLTWQNSKRASEFSSIDMAHNSPDLAAEVDVITNAANIKKLLKIPYERSHVSMMVHRVGKSLLLDDFDVHKHLLRQERTEWGWLKQFYDEYVLREQHEKMKCVPRPSKSRDNLQSQNMYSKFLYHSLCDVAKQQLTEDVSEADHFQLSSTDDKTVIPDPLPQPLGTQFHREILWTFEDIKMLIGTDMPVFCDDSYCVSLRLAEMRTPISVLTGLDYWLDNLMCNVPEVAMCFHIDGIVKKYEVIKTEDIPDLEDSKFDPCVVTEIAKNILSFLKNNATKEGHTYWLYKGTHDDVVKLYDLTALCGDEEEPVSQENPFTVPLGMLLYRVARNMWLSNNPGKAPLVRTLLENCLYLLDDKKHSQVCTSASYLLSDIYVPDSSLNDDWSLPSNSSSESNSDDESTQDSEEEDTDTETTNTTSVDVNALSKKGSVNRCKDIVRLKPFDKCPVKRCEESVKYIVKGLTCIDSDIHCDPHVSSSVVEEQAKCYSEQAIPLHYEPLKKKSTESSNLNDNTNLNCSENSDSKTDKINEPKNDKSNCSKAKVYKNVSESKLMENAGKGDDLKTLLQMTSVKREEEGQGQSWHQTSKRLLFRKASITFTAMTKHHIGKEEYLEAFKSLKFALYCLDAMKQILPQKAKENTALLSCLYGLAGDIRLVLCKLPQPDIDWDQLTKTFTSEQSAVLEMAGKQFDTCEYEWALRLGSDPESNLQGIVLCYTKALELQPKKNPSERMSLSKRRGNAHNELGVWYMHKAQRLLQNGDIGSAPSEEIEYLWRNSKDQLVQGIETFDSVADVPNQVLLLCNVGRLMKLCAQTYTHISLKGDKHEFTPVERYYFNMAIDYYQRALVLGDHGYKTIQDSIIWELSSTYFNMATLLQDYAPLSSVNKEEVEKEIITLMNKSLRYCKPDSGCANEPMYQFRAAKIHHRLASLFHSTLRADCTDQKKKHLRQLSETHYERAIKQFKIMECHIECLNVQLEYIALLEYSLAGQSSPGARLRLILQMLHCLADCQDSVRGLTMLLDDHDQSEAEQQQEVNKITGFLATRIQAILMMLIKAYNSFGSKKSKDKPDKSVIEELKALYVKSISTQTPQESLTLQTRCTFLQTLLTQVSSLYDRLQMIDKDSVSTEHTAVT